VHCVDGSLKLIGPRPIRRQADAQQCLAFLDLRAIPSCALLFGQPHERAIVVHARFAACVDEQHERKQTQRFGFAG
jgi:hypothetical protein